MITLDTFLVALYTIVDDLYKQHLATLKPIRRGRRPRFSDSEVLTLVIWAQWLRCSQRALLRQVRRYWLGYFPHLLAQSAFNRRARDLMGALAYLVPLVAQTLDAQSAVYQVFDGVPVPLARRCRGQHHRLFANEAGIGKGGSDSEWYYGCHLLVSVSNEGVITGFLVAPANTEGHWLAESLLCWRADPAAQPWGPQDLLPSHRRGGGYVGPTGPIWPRSGVGAASSVPYLVDSGYRGRAWAAHWQQDYAAVVMTPELYQTEGTHAARRQHSRLRQVVERVNERLSKFLDLHLAAAKTAWGALTQISAKLAAFNLGLWLNRLYGQPGLAFATLFS